MEAALGAVNVAQCEVHWSAWELSLGIQQAQTQRRLQILIPGSNPRSFDQAEQWGLAWEGPGETFRAGLYLQLKVRCRLRGRIH